MNLFLFPRWGELRLLSLQPQVSKEGLYRKFLQDFDMCLLFRRHTGLVTNPCLRNTKGKTMIGLLSWCQNKTPGSQSLLSGGKESQIFFPFHTLTKYKRKLAWNSLWPSNTEETSQNRDGPPLFRRTPGESLPRGALGWD